MNDEFSYTLRIPKDRVGVLIGKSGKVKRDIEHATGTRMGIDSKEGEVAIVADDGLRLYEAREVIRAIGRGFNPGIALQLLKMDATLEIIDVTAVTGKSKNALQRLKGRVIGAEGKAKREIERLTGCSISVYGKTIALIGEVTDVTAARLAVENLLQGATHATVYRLLEKRRRERKFERMVGKNDA